MNRHNARPELSTQPQAPARLREVGNLPIAVRVEINTGEVVVRSLATGEGHAKHTPIGRSTTPQSAVAALVARLAESKPGQIDALRGCSERRAVRRLAGGGS